MITITVDEFRDYLRCPVLYEKKYVLKEPPRRNRTSANFDGHSHVVDKADRVVHDIVSFYFHRLMDQRQIRYETLFKRWEKLWWNEWDAEDIIEYVVPVKRANMIRINTNFITHLPRFHSTFHRPFKPLLVDKEVFVPNGNTVLVSKIQMAYRLPNKVVRIVKFVPYSISPGRPEEDIDLVAQGCGWLHESDEDTVEISYYCMLSPREYNPFTVATLSRDRIQPLKDDIAKFIARSHTPEQNCSGCDYKCVENQ